MKITKSKFENQGSIDKINWNELRLITARVTLTDEAAKFWNDKPMAGNIKGWVHLFDESNLEPVITSSYPVKLSTGSPEKVVENHAQITVYYNKNESINPNDLKSALLYLTMKKDLPNGDHMELQITPFYRLSCPRVTI